MNDSIDTETSENNDLQGAFGKQAKTMTYRVLLATEGQILTP